MRPVALAGILASTTMLGGCAGTIAGVSFSSISSFAGIASTLFTGADLGEHAASIVTGKDCRFSEGLLREDRNICEEPGSLATRDDFHGIFVERIDEDGTIIYAAPKYMPAGVGAGENENNPDRIWAEIKQQKAKEEGERQLARAERAAQTIDVASLATGSLSSQSLAFLPGGVKVASAYAVDEDVASQTASRPRAVVNATAAKPTAEAKEPVVHMPLDSDQPAIEETALTATLEAAKTNGQGGPLITTTATSAPVASKLVNGEPVVILQLGPIFNVTQTTQETASALPSEPLEGDDTPTIAAAASAAPTVKADATPSPQAFLQTASRTPSFPNEVAPVEPQMIEARPQPKPTAAELAALEAAAKAKRAPRKRVEVAEQTEQADIYQPPTRGTASYMASPAPELTAAAPVQVPGDVPAEHAALPAAPAPAMTFSEPAPAPSSGMTTPAATSGPAPLYPMAQP